MEAEGGFMRALRSLGLVYVCVLAAACGDDDGSSIDSGGEIDAHSADSGAGLTDAEPPPVDIDAEPPPIEFDAEPPPVVFDAAPAPPDATPPDAAVDAGPCLIDVDL